MLLIAAHFNRNGWNKVEKKNQFERKRKLLEDDFGFNVGNCCDGTNLRAKK